MDKREDIHKRDYARYRLLIIGDAMIDEYIHGSVSRISPEAPVPVVFYEKTTRSLGGAANIALNARELGAEVDLFFVVGKDPDFETFKELLTQKKITFHPVILDGRKTTKKQRIVSQSQQLIRVDYETTQEYGHDEQQQVIQLLRDLDMQKYDAIILSDYAKGMFCTSVAEELKKLCKDRFVLADAKPLHIDLLSFCTLMKSNFSECKAYSQMKGYVLQNTDASLESASSLLLKNHRSWLITRSEKGMSYLSSEKTEHIPTNAKKVYDVTGAGDSVTAAFVLEYLRTGQIERSMDFANVVAGIVIAKQGCVPITLKDLNQYYGKKQNKILRSDDELKELVQDLHAQHKRIVFTNGCFDLLHSGHALFLQRAKEIGDVLIVGLNSDISVKRYKGPSRPIVDEESRLLLLSHLESVDYVVLFSEDDPRALIKKIRPSLHVKGQDYNEKIIEAEVVKECGGELVFLPLETENGKKQSTSDIITRMQHANKNSSR